MKLTKLLISLIIASAGLQACEKQAPDYSEFYPPEEPETPVTPEQPGDGTTVNVMSFNIRYDNPDEEKAEYLWDNRKKAFPAMTADIRPTVIGIQEARLTQKTWLDENLKGYKSIGRGRNDGANAEYMAIYYLDNEIEVQHWGTFWLSETPDKVSIGWDASVERSATWAILRHKPSGQKFFYINTHLDHKGTTARTESLKLIESYIAKLNIERLPAVVTADFNCPITDPAFDNIKKSMKDARSSCKESDNAASFNNFGKGTTTPNIDHILYSGFDGMTFNVVNRRYENVPYISDHYPISAILKFK